MVLNINLTFAMFVIAVSRPLMAQDTFSKDDLGIFPDVRLIDRVLVSADCENVVIAQQEFPFGSSLQLNGKEIAHRAKFGTIKISPDGSRTVWSAKVADKSYFYTSPDEYLPFDEMLESPEGVEFSPDSKHLAYALRSGSDWKLILDKVEGPAGNGPPSNFLFSADSRVFIYILTKGGKKQVVANNKADLPHDQIQHLKLSAVGGHVVYAASDKEGEWRVFVDGEAQRDTYKQIDEICINNDAQHLALVARFPNEDGYVVVVDGAAYRSFFSVPFPPVFSGNGAHFVFQGTRPGRPLRGPTLSGITVRDWKIEDPASQLLDWIYAPRGDDYACLEHESLRGGGPGGPGYTNKLTFGGQELVNSEDLIGGIVISPDGKRAAYATRSANDFRWRIAVGDQPEQYYRTVGPAVFSPSSKHVAYAAQKDNTWIMVLDGIELPFELLRPTLAGGPDGRWNTVPLRALNPGPFPLDISFQKQFRVPQIPYCFDRNDKLHFIGICDGRIFRIIY